MKSARVSDVAIGLAGMALAAAPIVACGVDLLAPRLPAWAHLALLAGGLVAGFVVVSLLQRRNARRRCVARQWLELLTRDGGAEVPDEMLPALDDGNPWREPLTHLRSHLDQSHAESQQLEQTRLKCEVRLRRMEDEQRQMAQIVAGLSDPVLAIDQFDELVLANPSAEALFGFDTEQSEQRALDRLVQCQELIDLLTDTRRRQPRSQRHAEMEVTDADGQTVPFRVEVSNLTRHAAGDEPADGGQVAVAVMRDISAHRAIQRRNAEFVSSVSHEMKTPLAGIKAYVELLADGDVDDEQTREEFLGVINGQADRLQRLIDNLLNLARIEAGVVEVNKEALSLNDVLEEALNVTAPAAEQKRITLTNALSPMHISVLADRDMILQSAINLLSNAIKYTPESGSVALRSRTDELNAQFEVEDTGVGLSGEDCEKVFDKFYRVRKDRQMAAGTGLGLPLAKHIVEDVHGGRLEVESELEQGSTFRVTLALARDIS